MLGSVGGRANARLTVAARGMKVHIAVGLGALALFRAS
jgi:hypothetical protein